MSVHHLFPANDSPHPDAGLLAALQQWRDPDWTPTTESHVPERRAIDVNRVAVERANGTLMRRFGLETFQAFSLMVRWSRLTQTPVHTLARTLVQAIDEADPQPERRHRPLSRWLEGQLRHAGAAVGPLHDNTRPVTEPGRIRLRILSMSAEPGGAGAPHSRS